MFLTAGMIGPKLLLTDRQILYLLRKLRGDVLDFQSFLLSSPGKHEILKEIATVKKGTSEILSHVGCFILIFMHS